MLTTLDNLRQLLIPEPDANSPRAFFLQRLGGLGDVIMALSAIHGLREHFPSAKIHLLTEERYRPLADRCPHLDGVHTSHAEFQGIMHDHGQKNFRVERLELGGVNFGINHDHEVNAFLTAMKIYAPPEHKGAVVRLKRTEAEAAGRKVEGLLKGFSGKRVLLHPSRGDRNRTWSLDSWNALVDLILAAGQTPVLIGDDSTVPYKGILKPEVKPGVADLTNRLTLLELVELCGRSDVSVSPDSGPIQVAGLTDIGIVGIYSTVLPRCRLPFRHGMLGWRAEGLTSTCPHRGCYNLILKDDRYFRIFQRAVQMDLVKPGCQATNIFMGEFCAYTEAPYSCLEEVTPAMVWAACERLLDPRPYHDLASNLKSARKQMEGGDPRGAQEALERIQVAHPGTEVEEIRALAQAAEGQVERAVRILNEVIKKVPGPEPFNLIAMLMLIQGDVHRAGQTLEAMASWNGAFSPTILNITYHRALQACEARRVEEALFLLDAFIRLRRAISHRLAPYVMPTHHGLLRKAWLVLEYCNPDWARACFEEVLAETPDSPEAALGLAESFFQAGLKAEASELFQAILDLDPSSELARKRLADMKPDSGTAS